MPVLVVAARIPRKMFLISTGWHLHPQVNKALPEREEGNTPGELVKVPKIQLGALKITGYKTGYMLLFCLPEIETP